MPIVKANKQNIAKAAEIIKAGGAAAFPTETVYGLGANAFDRGAVGKIFALKGRPADNPLIVHIGNLEDLGKIANCQFPISNYGNPHLSPPPADRGRKEGLNNSGNDGGEAGRLAMIVERLITRFWPGALTLILPKKKEIPYGVTAGLETVAVRMPAHPVALHLIHLAGVPIAAPSANISGRPSPTTAAHVAEDFPETLFILDGGKTKIGVESTVLDLTASPPAILRAGAVTVEMIKEIIPDVQGSPSTSSGTNTLKPKAPGMKYRHYAPKAKLILMESRGEQMVADIQYFINSHPELKIGVLASREYAERYANAKVVVLGSRKRPDLCAKNLFSSLRKFDKLGVDAILAENFPEEGMGVALMERLRKAAM